jgi:phage-related protein
MKARIAYGENFVKFYKSQEYKVQKKIEYVLDLVRFEHKIRKKFIKYLSSSNGIYEIRVRTAFREIRILCFFDKGDLVILTNCFLKKNSKNT